MGQVARLATNDQIPCRGLKGLQKTTQDKGYRLQEAFIIFLISCVKILLLLLAERQERIPMPQMPSKTLTTARTGPRHETQSRSRMWVPASHLLEPSVSPSSQGDIGTSLESVAEARGKHCKQRDGHAKQGLNRQAKTLPSFWLKHIICQGKQKVRVKHKNK